MANGLDFLKTEVLQTKKIGKGEGSMFWRLHSFSIMLYICII
jgi:hypothetical protein